MSVTVQDLRAWKSEGRRFAMLTAWDYPTARLLDEAGIPVILVGDTLAENILGYSTTLPVTMDAMIHHCQAVARGALILSLRMQAHLASDFFQSRPREQGEDLLGTASALHF